MEGEQEGATEEDDEIRGVVREREIKIRDRQRVEALIQDKRRVSKLNPLPVAAELCQKG